MVSAALVLSQALAHITSALLIRSASGEGGAGSPPTLRSHVEIVPADSCNNGSAGKVHIRCMLVGETV